MDHTNLDLTIPQELTAEEAAAVFGGAMKGSIRRLKRKYTKNSVRQLKRQKKGINNIRHRTVVNSPKQTQSRSSQSGANRFAF